MRVLLSANMVLPAVAEQLELPTSSFGGWLSTVTERLSKQSGITLGVAMRAGAATLKRIEHEGVCYYALPRRRYNAYDTPDAAISEVLDDFKPDIVHVEGTEMPYARRLLSAWAGAKVVSLQGVINGHVAYQLGRIPTTEFFSWRNPGLILTFLALIANDRLRFRPRLAGERQALTMASHVVGRTLWDRAQAAWLAPQASYHHCPRILREPFYKRQWVASDCEAFSIFVGNGASALKGAHFALRALPLVQRRFPKVRLYIAGRDPFQLGRFSAQRTVGYSRYLIALIKSLGIEAAVSFTGQLDAEAMAERMGKSHVVLLPSLIENSPNTLAEAMMLGVPTVAAYVGGVPSMATDEEDALLFRSGDPAMLAFQINRLFEDPALCQRLSRQSRERACQVHQPDAIIGTLISIYQKVLKQG